jgi:GNAT superfamily N-acetyltransferase
LTVAAPPAAPAARYAAAALLRDGTSVRIRAIQRGDKAALGRHFAALGPDSRYFRFFGMKKALTDEELRYFTEPDFRRHVGLVAVRLQHGREEIVGVARYTPCQEAPDDAARAEFAVAVADAWQGRGIGTVLLEHLAQVALAHGITEFEADVLGHNTRMVAMLRATGFDLHLTSRCGVFR